jgi:hypothetical protein
MFVVYLDPSMTARPRIARAFLTGVLAWFVLDGAVSLMLGAFVNVIGNVVFLALLLPPLVALSRDASPGP